MSMQSQQKNMKTIHNLVSQELNYIYGERESGPNGTKKQFHTKSATFLRALSNDLGFKEFKVTNNHGGIATSGEITLMGIWEDGNGLYFQISQSLMQPPSFLYRAIKNMKNYSSGVNQWIPCSLFETGNYEKLTNSILELRKPNEKVVLKVA